MTPRATAGNTTCIIYKDDHHCMVEYPLTDKVDDKLHNLIRSGFSIVTVSGTPWGKWRDDHCFEEVRN